MPVLDRASLEASPLADLHEIASALSLDGFRRLRKADLIGAILKAQGVDDPGPSTPPDTADIVATEAPDAVESSDDGGADDPEEKPARRSRRGGRSRRGRTARDTDSGAEEGTTDEDAGSPPEDEPVRSPRPPRRRARSTQADEPTPPPAAPADEPPSESGPETTAEGVIELLGNGSGFVRVDPPEPSDDDVYVSAAQVRRCELVSGDRVSGPVRPPRRSERYPSLVRVDTINGTPADEVAEGTHFEDLPAAFPSERFALGGEDATLKAIEWLTPIGRGSRVTIVGGARAGKTEALRRLAGALAAQEGLELIVVLVGARPEEVTEWKAGPSEPVAALTLAASPDAQAQAVERAVDTAKRIAARGGHAAVLVDSVGSLPPHAARKALAAARDIVDGGSLTIIATAPEPVGGETTVIALDAALTSTGRFPALDLVASGTLRPELLVGPAGADAIAQARGAALG